MFEDSWVVAGLLVGFERASQRRFSFLFLSLLLLGAAAFILSSRLRPEGTFAPPAPTKAGVTAEAVGEVREKKND